MPQLKLLPYQPEGNASSFKRTIVKPIPKEDAITEGGLLIASDINNFCESGRVVHVCDNSDLKAGDIVLYKKIDRKSAEHLDTISVDSEVCDVLYENEIWAYNGHPLYRIFVEQISTMEVNEEGLLLPESVKTVTQKGKVFRAPSHYTVAPGDIIEYRKPERDIYPTVVIDGKRYDVLYEADVFLVNNKVAPFRIIVRIDMVAQSVKRNTTATGLVRSPLFSFMLHNMQVGQVLDIGAEAQKHYPDLRIGDSAILHHTVEAQDFRLLRRTFSEKNKGTLLYEDRIINAFDPTAREIFGRIVNRKKMIISEFGKNDFLNWNFTVYAASAYKSSELFDFESNIDKCTNLEDLKSVIKHKKDDGHGKAHAKIKGLLDIIREVNPETDKDRFDELETELNQAKREAIGIANHLDANHLLRCQDLRGYEILVPYRELYPINIFGHKYIIAYEDFIVSHIHTDQMGKTIITPHADRLLIRPIAEEDQGELIIPQAAKEKPQRGEVLAVGPGKDGKELTSKVGEEVLYRKGAGTPIEIDKEVLLLMREGVDTIATISLEAGADTAI